MTKFIIKLVLFCLAPLVVLIPMGLMVDEGLQKSRYFYYAEWNDLFHGTANADMVVLGTSRAWVQFSPQVIDSMLGLDCYNMGMDGAPFDVQYERFKIYMRYNRKPSYVLQEVGFNTTFTISTGLPLYQQFLPYLRDSSIWRIVKKAYQNVGTTDRYFPLYKYNNQLPLIKEGVWSYMGRSRPAVKYKGYQGQNRKWDNSFDAFARRNPTGITCRIDTAAVALFKEYLAYCKQNDIKVFMVYAPFYYEMHRLIRNHKDITDLLADLSQKYDAPLLDYTHCYLDSGKQYFYNSQHLNRDGAERFSAMLAQDISQFIR